MNILMVHNFYNISGGEDSVFHSESLLLNSYEQNVSTYTLDNSHIASFTQKLLQALSTHYSRRQYDLITKKLVRNNTEIMHVHNFFPRLTPSIFYAAHSKHIPTVMTLHNYRIVCPTSLLMWNGMPCENSIGSSAYWAVKKRVYRNSMLGTAVLAHMIEYHKKNRTWHTKVDRFICLTEFARQKFIDAGLPKEKLVVKPNFFPDPGYDEKTTRNKRAVFVGRLSIEKGIDVLMKAWSSLNYSIDVIGEGESSNIPKEHVDFIGKKSKTEVIEYVKRASFIIVPSICYEGFPMAIVEAFSCGTPVLCSRLGSMKEIVKHGVTGLHFEPGNSEDLAEKAKWMFDNPDKVAEMGRNARNEYIKKYTPERNYEMLMDIYSQAIDEVKARGK